MATHGVSTWCQNQKLQEMHVGLHSIYKTVPKYFLIVSNNLMNFN